MRLALISDIHANLEALEAVFRDIEKEKVETVHCLGDVVGYGSDPSACVTLVDEHCDVKLMGNHEYAILELTSTENYNSAAKQATDWTKEQMSDFDLSTISNFKMSVALDNKTRVVHASPQEPEKWHYILSPTKAFDAFLSFKENICFFGHTHLPQIYIEMDDSLPRGKAGHDFLPDPDNRYLINVGSVGQPRDNDPRACYVIFDTEEYEIIYQRVEYDIKTTQQKMLQANLPQMLAQRLSVGR